MYSFSIWLTEEFSTSTWTRSTRLSSSATIRNSGGRPIAVGRGEGRGVVATASYEARRYGVHSAMPSYRAKELCPNLIFIHPNMQRYKEVSGAIQAIFRRYTPLVQPISIDEAFLDITESPIPFASGTEAALRIKREIREELSLCRVDRRFL